MIDRDGELVRLLGGARYVLLDFDGPVADVFGGVTALAAGLRLRRVMADLGLRDAAADVPDRHPLGIYETAATEYPSAAEVLDKALRAIELEAAETAVPTPGAEELLRACIDAERPVAIVSNNAREAVEHYLHVHQLEQLIAHVAARSTAQPSELKPRPHLPLAAMVALSATAENCVLIGDSVSDIHAARGLNVPAIGYANKPGKGERLRAAGAAATTSDMLDLARIVTHLAE